MTFGYIRVSTDQQTVENQRFEINQYCEKHGMKIDGWIEETISGTKNPEKRKLGKLLKKVQSRDIIICSEISRLGRSLYMIMDILSLCMEKGCQVRTIKDGFVLGDDIQSKVLAFAFGLSAEIERNLISQRTKEALAMRKASGVKLGRPKGSLGESTKLTQYEETIKTLIVEQDNCYADVAKLFHVNRSTMKRFCDKRGYFRPSIVEKNQRKAEKLERERIEKEYKDRLLNLDEED